MTQEFVHLRVHSEYSLSDGMVRIKPLTQACRDNGMPAVAVSDRNNLFALVKFYNAAEAAGVKPIVASDIWVVGDNSNEEATPFVLIARNNTGYRNLCELLSRSYADGQSMGVAGLRRGWIAEQSEGLMALSGGRQGDIGRALLAGNRDEAKRRTERWMEIFPDAFYLELHRTGRDNEENYNNLVIDLAIELSCPVVATNDVRFLSQDEFEAHEVRVCIHDSRTLDDPRREQRYSDQQYLKTAAEMCELFSDLPEAIENSVEIARRCNVTLNLGNYYLPEYPVPEGKTTEDFLSEVATAGLENRLRKILDPAADNTELRKAYEARLAFELDVINSMGFPGYFLIVMEFIQWAKDNDIPVGPGRGSGAGSLVAYALKITDIDPLEYDLLFERFLNPERVSLPDFDIDFCMDGRDRVIQHVTERYGRQAVSQIITFGTMAAKAVVRDVARVQGKPYGLADKLSKLIPFEPGMTLTRALEEEPLLRDFVASSEEAQEIMEMAFKLEGLARNVGRHAGGVVIAPTRLTDFTPTYCDETGSGLMTQFDMNDVEQAGLVKFDFLGLRTLTIIDNAVKSINARKAANGEPPVDIEAIELEDPCIYENLRQAKTTAVFQLESRGMKDLMKKVKPNRFGDIVALVALFRPGPMQLADDFIERKNNPSVAVDYLHPSLKHILEGTYGVMLYQEQVMQIAQVLAGYTLADADLLRRAMGKKKPEEMAKQRQVFLEGAMKNGVEEGQADHIFNLMEKFAGYGFNKPHSVAYALIAYQTAWLKHFYPADFMAAVLSADMQNTDKVVVNIEECREMGLTLQPPDVNRGDYRFIADTEQSIVYGLGAIKGLGEGPIESIVNSRTAGGAFKDLYHFCEQVDQRRVNRRAVEALIGSGALDHLVDRVPPGIEDEIGFKRALLIANQDDAVGLADQKARNEDSGLTDLFGSDVLVTESTEGRYNHFDKLKCLSFRDRLAKEKDSLGLFLTGHLVDEYREEFRHFVDSRIVDLRSGLEDHTIGGLIVAMRTMKSRRGETIAFATLDDKSGRVEVAIFGDVFDGVREKLLKDHIVFIRGSTAEDDFTGGIRMRANEVFPIEEARVRRASNLRVELSSARLCQGFIDELAGTLQPFKPRGAMGCKVAVKVMGDVSQGDVILGDEWRVVPHDDLLESLKDLQGIENVSLQYL